MKKKTKLWGVIALAAVIGWGLTGCEQPTDKDKKTIDRIEVTAQPTKTQYTIGEALDLAGLEVTAYYTDDTSEKVAVAESHISGFDTSTEGGKTITITYEGKTASFPITVIKPVKKIEITSPPTATKIAIGEDLVLTGLVVTATFTDDETGTVTITAANISGFDSSTAGEKTVTVNYGGATATFKVTVVGVSSIAITNPPTKTKYAVGEELNLEGLGVTATFTDGDTGTVTITADHISGFDSSTAGEKTVTVSYSGKTATFKVTIVGLDRIEITQQPTKTEYGIGEPLDITGLEVTATYSDGDTETVTITAANISGFNSATIGTKTLTVTWNGKTASFAVTVASLPVTAQGSTLAQKLAWVRSNARSDTTYILEVSADESLAPQELSYGSYWEPMDNITVILQGIGGEKTVSLSGNGSLFSVPDGVTLVLEENIILKGHDDNNAELVWVNNTGSLVMEAGSKITGNEGGGWTSGVMLHGGFTMNGGEISGTATDWGGAVYVAGGTFTMNGGKISDNTGGGVYIQDGTFTMNGGEISGNNNTWNFGGVYVGTNSTFNWESGTITGNTPNDVYPNNITPGHEHEWGNWTQISAPGCETAGEETRVCALNPLHTETRAVAALGHDYVWEIITPATCTVEGERKGTCSRNPAHTVTETVAAGHEWGDWVQTTDPTCTAEGEDTATCERDPEHTKTQPVAIDPDAHDWGEYIQTTPPTCTEVGIKTRVCLRDSSHIDTENTQPGDPAIGHEWGAWEVTAGPTFITEGVETRTCMHDSSHTETRAGLPSLLITTTAEWDSAISQINGKTGDYTLTIGGTFGVAGRTTASFGTTATGSALNVTLKGSGKLYLTSQGYMLYINTNQTLVIDSEDLTLEGLRSGQNGASQNNNQSTVYVYNGTLEMRNGKISGNNNTSADGGGVYSRGTFTMYGGTISGNTVDSGGGGVYNSGTFTMHGGTISGNRVVRATFTLLTTMSAGGGGVYNYGTFTMNGGEISGNIAQASIPMPSGNMRANGGGVYVLSGTFTMNGGKITGNAANAVNNATNAITGYGDAIAGGGGVYVASSVTFTMNGGEISGNTAYASRGTASSTLSARGGGVYVLGGTFRIVTGTIYGSGAAADVKNTAAQSGAALEGTAQRGTFSGDTWVSSGDLTTTNNTIRVVNGLLQ